MMMNKCWLSTMFQTGMHNPANYTSEVVQSVLEYMMITASQTVLAIIMMYLYLASGKTEMFNSFKESSETEMSMTIVPMATILFLAVPTINAIYSYEWNENAQMNMKVTGNQWYWTYEMLNMEPSQMYMNSEDSMIRLLETDNSILVPTSVPIKMSFTSSDVMHSWAMPKMSVKMDAIPGRINEMTTTINESGLFYGQCSEICGAGHSFMPIQLESKPLMKIESN